MKSIASAIASALLVGGAYAQSPPQSTGSPRTVSAMTSETKASHPMPLSGVEKHIQQMHAKLRITAAEEGQWTAVAEAMRSNAVDLDAAIDKREANAADASAVDNLNAYRDIAQSHLDGVTKLAAAFAPLYAAMPDSQKKLADAVFAQRAEKHPAH